MATVQTIVEPFSPYNSTCGYCNSSRDTNFQSASLHAYRMSCSVYQRMIDRGWRRSGLFCYKPDLKRSCCPQYTIKLDATEFKASKSQRKLINRWNRFVLGGNNGAGEPETTMGEDTARLHKGKGSSNEPQFVLEDAIHASENALNNSAHVFEKHIHKKPEKKSEGFKRFLVETPLQREPIPYPSTPPARLPSHYGSYHQLYRLDGKLVGMGVIDILPSCVSSVYFMWEKEYEKFSLGKLSALQEISLAKEFHDAGVPQLKYLYMGYYIYTCQKMKYKGEYSPSFLADPEDFTWHPLPACQRELERFRYACFTHPEHSLEGPPPLLGIEPPPKIPEKKLSHVCYFVGTREDPSRFVPVTKSKYWKNQMSRASILYAVEHLGVDLSQDVLFLP
ncbi:arginine-tRNA-protein transferase [Lactarius psammicola]|nr:arginine-tRNA-protein transferase [Lactarius psammicola]